MEDTEMSGTVEPQDPAETSKAGARRMRRLLSSPKLCRPSRAAIHPYTAQLIYPSPSPAYPGHLTTPLFSAERPTPLPTPPVFTPGQLVSTNPTGEWVVIFHPNAAPPGQAIQVEGGTLAVYPLSILGPTSNPGNVIPLASFPLPSDVLAIQHLYPPRTYLPPPAKRASARGPTAPPEYSASHGPALLLLLRGSVVLIHPQATSTLSSSDAPKQYAMGMLTCPLHTRWHASPGGAMPPDIGQRLDQGWTGLVSGDEGVWVGWERKGQIGALRAEVGMTNGSPYLRTTPMPRLPVRPSPAPPSTGETIEQASNSPVRRSCQGMVFLPVPAGLLGTKATEDDTEMSAKTVENRLVVGAGVISRESGLTSESGRTRIEVFGFERREVELVDGLGDNPSGEEEGNGPAKRWDWFTIPHIIRTSIAPPSYHPIALTHLPDVPPGTLAVALVSSGQQIKLVHLDLCPGSSDLSEPLPWGPVGEAVELELDGPGLDHVEIVPSQAVQRGLGGLVAVISPPAPTQVKLVIMPPILSPEKTRTSEYDAALAITLAVKQGVSYADVTRTLLAIAGEERQAEFTLGISQQAYLLFKRDAGDDELVQLHKLQVALFSTLKDARAPYAAELVRLYDAAHLFYACIKTSEVAAADGAQFHIDTVWSLLSVAEWVSSSLANIFRSVLAVSGAMAWSTDPTEGPGSHDISPRILYLLVPDLRALLLRLLSQLKAFKAFVQDLEEPILQPVTKFMPLGRKRDPRATVIARDRGRDLGQRDGLDIEMWGRALAEVQDLSEEIELSPLLHTAYLVLDPSPLLAHEKVVALLQTLPAPSSLLLAAPVSEEEYDAVTFESLSSPMAGSRGMASCDRCASTTALLGSEQMMLAQAQAELGYTESDNEEGSRGIMNWIRERAEGCGCGGIWIRAERGGT